MMSEWRDRLATFLVKIANRIANADEYFAGSMLTALDMDKNREAYDFPHRLTIEEDGSVMFYHLYRGNVKGDWPARNPGETVLNYIDRMVNEHRIKRLAVSLPGGVYTTLIEDLVNYRYYHRDGRHVIIESLELPFVDAIKLEPSNTISRLRPVK